MPAHDTTVRVGAVVRVLHAECWFNARAARARLQRLQAGWGAMRPAGLLPGRGARGASDAEALRRGREAGAAFHQGSRLGASWTAVALQGRGQLERTRVDPLTQLPLQTEQTKALVLRSKCRQQPLPTGLQGARPLDWLVPEAAAEWPVNCEAHAEICSVVREVAVERAVMAAVSNSNILGMLGQVRIYMETHIYTCSARLASART